MYSGDNMAAVTLAIMLQLIAMTSLIHGQKFITYPQTIEVVVGEKAIIPCTVHNLGSTFVSWLRNQAVISVNSLVISANKRYSVTGKYNLTLSGAQLYDEGQYTCQIATEPVVEQTSSLIVNVPPTVVLHIPQLIERTLHDNVTLSCNATGKPHPLIKWIKMDQDWILSEGTTYTLTDLKPGDHGTYQCVADNGVLGPVLANVTIKLTYPPIAIYPRQQVFTGHNLTTELRCAFQAEPRASVYWSYENQPVDFDGNENYHISHISETDREVSVLTITNTNQSHLGNYSCELRNHIGTDAGYFHLQGVPERSMITSTQQGQYSTQYSLEWTVYSYDVPGQYRIFLQMRNNSDEISDWREIVIAAKSVPLNLKYSHVYTLRGLEPSMEYGVLVQAMNYFGWGEVSEPFMFITNKEGFTPPPPSTPSDGKYLNDIEGDNSGSNDNYGTYSSGQSLCVTSTILMTSLAIVLH